MTTGKFIGCTMIVIGTIVGAGMLALPLVGAGSGFILSSTLMILLWLGATMAGLLVLEVNLAFPINSCSFSKMAQKTLGNFGRAITWIAYLFLLYAMAASYIIGQTDLTEKTFGPMFNIEMSPWMISIAFTVILGAAVFWSTKAVDYFNRGVFSIKGLLLIATIAFIVPHVEISKLIYTPEISQMKYLWIAMPTFMCAFCFHFIIPSLRMYVGDNPKQLRSIIITGTTSSLVIYLLWLIVTMGIVPITGNNSFTTFAHESGTSVGHFNRLLIHITNSKWVANSLHGFTNIAMTTSFLGVALGLFDFLAEGFKRPNTRFGRLQTALLTFMPPLVFALFFPEGFLMAINYGAIAIAILTFILPALMAFYARRNKELSSPYRAKCNTLGIIGIVITGVATMVLGIMFNLDLLPTL